MTTLFKDIFSKGLEVNPELNIKKDFVIDEETASLIEEAISPRANTEYEYAPEEEEEIPLEPRPLPPTDHIESKEVEDHFMFKLTEKEIVALSQDQVQLHLEKGRKESELARIKSRFKAELEEIEGQLNANYEKIEKGESRKVTCTKVVNFTSKMVMFIHEGVLLRERKMNEEEAQLELKMFEKDKKK